MPLLLTFLALGFGSSTPALAASLPVIEYNASTSEAIVLSYAIKYGIKGSEFLNTLKCESGLDPKAWNHTDPHGGSKGIAQFQQSTFNKYSKLAGIENGDVWNPFDAINTAAFMFSKGQQGQWSCYTMIKKKQANLSPPSISETIAHY